MDPYLKLLGLIALLFFLPKILVRVGIPSPVTEMSLGVACGPLFLGLVEPGELLMGLAGLGISALFLFAGLEVEVHELVERRRTLLEHVGIQLLLFAGAAWMALALGTDLAAAVLIAAGLMSSSAGFIVPALDALGFTGSIASWIKQKAIATELLAIAAVLLFSNTGSGRDLVVGLGGIIGLVAGEPVAFYVFHKTILRWAPRTEFSFVMVMALLAAYLTHHLGVHYLVGAFVVGLIARRYLDWAGTKKLKVAPVRAALNSFRFFSAFFVPFFFFLAGVRLPEGALSRQALLFAGAMLLLATPLRVGSVLLHRRGSLNEPFYESWNVGLLLGPTTVFSVAVAEILQDRFTIDEWVVGGLVLYGAGTSMLPLLTRRFRSTEFEDVVSFGDVDDEHPHDEHIEAGVNERPAGLSAPE